jgi:hypothetical protein
MKSPRGEVTATGTFILAILLAIALGIVWVATGGPSRSSSHSGAFLTPPWPLAGSSTPSFFFPTLSRAGQTDASETPSYAVTYVTYQGEGGGGTGNGPFTFLSRFGAGSVTIDSPYAGKVFLEIGNARESDTKREYVILRTASGLNQSVTVTGWTLMSATSNIKVKVGEGALIPFLGQVNVETPIALGGNTTVSMITGRAPNGTSFRVSKCTGYFEQFQDFTPSLPIECPLPEDELDRLSVATSYNDLCFDFVGGLSRCILNINALPPNVGSLCQNFVLNTLSYSGCVTAHKNDPDFYRNDWRVYLNRDQELWKNGGGSWRSAREEIRLLDENGKVVDVVSY